ncbi:MAG: hypothetical protein LIO94_10585 [Clostridiales bacterium]|nr:hypothetical protein [Clostridiales bacterium]
MKIRRMFTGLFLFLLMSLFMVPACSAQAASYQVVNTYENPKVGGVTFSFSSGSSTNYLYVTKNGTKSVLCSGQALNPEIVTNGSKVYCYTWNYNSGTATVYKADVSTRKIEEEVFSVSAGENFTLGGYYNGKIYYVKGLDPGTLCSYTVSSGKHKSLVNNVTEVTQSGKYLYLTPYNGDVGPSTLRVYNASSGKVKTITKKLFTYTVLSGKVYYVEFKSSNIDGYGPWKVRVRRCALNGGSKKTLISSLSVNGIVKIGKKSIKYLNSNGTQKTKKY